MGWQVERGTAGWRRKTVRAAGVALLVATALPAWAGPIPAARAASGTEAEPLALVTPGPAQWRSTCEGSTCRSEIVVQAEAGPMLLRLWLGRSPEGQDYLGVLAPLGIYLPGTVQLSLDGGQSAVAALPLLDCSPQGCRGVTPASTALLSGLARAGTVTVLMRDSRTRSRIGVAVPMTGFKDSLVPMMLKRG